MLAPLHVAPLAYFFVFLSMVCSFYALSNRPFFESWCMHPYRIYRGRRIFTVFASVLIHGNRRHLVVTLLLLAVGMPEVEYMLIDDFGPLHGRLWLLFAIVFTAGFAGLLSVVQYRNQALQWSSGGSALFYSMATLYLIYLPLEPLSSLPVFLQPLLPVWFAGMLFFVLTILALLKDSAGAIHLYGALAGILFAFMARPQAMREIVSLFPFSSWLEERNDKAARHEQAGDDANNDPIEDCSFAAFAACYCHGLGRLHTMHPRGDG